MAVSGCVISDPPSLVEFGGCFIGIIKLVVALGGVAAVITFLMGAFKYVTSRGDEKAVAAARDTITWSVIGLVVVSLSYAIIYLLDRSLFSQPNSLLNFEIPSFT